jgi:hypothetical protein
VTYLNKLGTFTGPHSMTLTDAKGMCVCMYVCMYVCINTSLSMLSLLIPIYIYLSLYALYKYLFIPPLYAKGKTSAITAARFVLATGGRPSSLKIPGWEYAISSDDLFMLQV